MAVFEAKSDRAGDGASMRGVELKKAAIRLFGQERWRSEMADRLGLDRTTIWRYVEEESPIPGPVIAAVRGWLAVDREKRRRAREAR